MKNIAPPSAATAIIHGTSFVKKNPDVEVVAFRLFLHETKWWAAVVTTDDFSSYRLTTTYAGKGSTPVGPRSVVMTAVGFQSTLDGCRKRRIAHGYELAVRWDRAEGICLSSIYDELCEHTGGSFSDLPTPLVFSMLHVEVELDADAEPTSEDLAIEDQLAEQAEERRVASLAHSELSKTTKKLIPSFDKWQKSLGL